VCGLIADKRLIGLARHDSSCQGAVHGSPEWPEGAWAAINCGNRR
jgi:hypothetical protein